MLVLTFEVVKVLFWIAALGASSFYGWYAVTIFNNGQYLTYCSESQPQHQPADHPANSTMTASLTASPMPVTVTIQNATSHPAPPHHWSWWFHQLWLNFIASLTGWGAAYYLIFDRVKSCSSFKFELGDAIPLVIALLGITGLLPYTMSKLNNLGG